MSIVRAVEVLLESLPSIPEAARAEIRAILDDLKQPATTAQTVTVAPESPANVPSEPPAETPADTGTADVPANPQILPQE